MIQSLWLTIAQLDAHEVGLPKVAADDSGLQVVLKLVFGVVTLLTVIYLILTGLKLITQQGDPVGLSKARQAIIYGILGLVIVLTADAIVFFVLGRI